MKNRILNVIQTNSFSCALFQTITVTLIYMFFGLLILMVKGEWSSVNVIDHTNVTLKFSMWLFLGYGTIQALGRRVEYENIERAIQNADKKQQDGLNNAKQDEDKNAIETEHTNAHRTLLEVFEIIASDESRTAPRFYMVGIGLFILTSVLDLLLLAIK